VGAGITGFGGRSILVREAEEIWEIISGQWRRKRMSGFDLFGAVKEGHQ